MDKEQVIDKKQREVTVQIRCAIKKKLRELIDFDDEELPEYIMILIANKKSKAQIEKDLLLFLGDKTSDFTNWLLDLLNSFKSMDSVKSNNENSCLKKQDAEPDEDALLLLDCDPDEQTGDLFSHEDTNDSILSKSSNRIKSEVPNKVGVLKSEAAFNKYKKVKEKIKTVESSKDIHHATKGALSSAVVSVKKVQECDAEYDPAKPDYASSVINNSRRYSVPEAFQANKLLLKAVNDATKSILKGKSVTEFYKPTPIKVLTSKRYRTPFGNADNALVEQALTSSKITEQPEIDHSSTMYTAGFDSDILMEDSFSCSDFPSPQNSRSICLKNIPLLTDNSLQESAFLPSSNPNSLSEEEVRPASPHFTVTLDGIDATLFKRKLDEMSVDSFEDEDLIEDIPVDKKQKLNERCKYWPACKNSDQCPYHHPTVACKSFPDCRYGDKCLYIHPNCKFDALCSRKDCPFTHASKRKLPWISPISIRMKPMKRYKVKTVCKFYPKCSSKGCIYFHPKMCRYGADCRAPKCIYGHYSVPSRSQMKWQAADS